VCGGEGVVCGYCMGIVWVLYGFEDYTEDRG
jgi:hypothetical protein